MPDTQPRPFISVVMGSVSDWTVMKRAVEMLRHFDVRVETRVISAHRMPDQMFAYAQSAQERGLAAIIAGAGGAAHLPGMLAAKTTAPVLGVPIPGPHLQGIDALHSIVQMPKGIPVAAFAIGEAGAANAALFAIAMLGRAFPALARQLDAFRQQQTEKACAMTLPPVSARAAQSEF
ncbi:5-(carboxyamino)imidazole ribonucleotide mutase [Candidatus Glomeribacter gigasporarum]|nr:5-(carboxyamino)imidazole ribonucleotide mutase [Candidatus Glomeribacter gigasporarum]